MSKQITFPIVKGTTRRRNAETGVEIVKSEPDNGDGTYYTVDVFGRDSADVIMSWSAPTLAEAREYAIGAVVAVRAMRAAAYAEALTENAERDAVPTTVTAVEIVDGREVPVGEPRTTTTSRGALDLLHGEARVDARGLSLGIGHVAPATIARAYDEALAEDAERFPRTEVVVDFERIGSRRGPASMLRLTVSPAGATNPTALAELVHRHARQFITSRFFEVEVDMETGRVLLDGGRFGSGSFTPPVGAPTALAVIDSTPTVRRHPMFEGMAMPRADRLAASFEAFNGLADSGGPGTSRGLIRAVELASSITPAQLDAVTEALGFEVADRVSRALELVGITVR